MVRTWLCRRPLSRGCGSALGAPHRAELRTTVDPELAERRCQLVRDGVDGDAVDLGDLLRGVATGCEIDHLTLALGEGRRTRWSFGPHRHAGDIGTERVDGHL